MTFQDTNDGVTKASFIYIWNIEFPSSFTLSSTLFSPVFIIQAMESTKWHLEAVMNKEGLFLFICRDIDGWPWSIEIDYKFSLLDSNEMLTLDEEAGQGLFEKLGSLRSGVFFNRNFLAEGIIKNTLTIRCQIWKSGSDILQSDLCFARTRLEMVRHDFVWAIKRFSSLRPGQNRKIFLHPTFEKLPTLILTFLLQEKDGKEYGCITVHRNPVTKAHLMEINVSILDCDGWLIHSTSKESESWIMPEKEKVCELNEILERSEILSDIPKYLPNDVLSLKCEIQINAGPIWSRIENYRQLVSPGVETFASEVSEFPFDRKANTCCPFKKMLKTLYKDETFSDIALKTGSETFSVHKNILSARSPVFKAMFTKDMKEKTENLVEISDISADTMRCVLAYIYTDNVEELHWQDASDLFIAADKYELVDLREKCSYLMKSNLSSLNVCNILVLADMHQDEDLLRAARDFILHRLEIFDSDEWKDLKKKHTNLAFETAEKIICTLKYSGI